MREGVQPYAAPRWLPGGHAQTIWPLLIKGAPPGYRRERWDTPDGDFIDVDRIDAPGGRGPLLVLFHGLEGSSRSHYARALMHAAQRDGWDAAVVHFRGCSDEPNRLPRAYHSGDLAEVDWILRPLRLQRPAAPLFAIGVSLGGNALLKWLGEQGAAAQAVDDDAAGISVPLDLAAAALPHRASPAVTFERPAEGGHAGFVSGPLPGTLSWMPARVMAYFRAMAGMP